MTDFNFFCENNMVTMARYPDKYFKLAICDPPYFSGPESKGYYGKELSGHGVKRRDYAVIDKDKWEIPTKEYFRELLRISKHQIIWGINYFDVFLGPGRIIWDKVNLGNDFSDCEQAYCSFHDSTRLYRYMWSGMMQGKSISEGHIMQGNKLLNQRRIHQTEKPIILYDWIFQQYAQPGMKVYDSHGGYMSIALSAYKYQQLSELVISEQNSEHFLQATERFYKFKAERLVL